MAPEEEAQRLSRPTYVPGAPSGEDEMLWMMTAPLLKDVAKRTGVRTHGLKADIIKEICSEGVLVPMKAGRVVVAIAHWRNTMPTPRSCLTETGARMWAMDVLQRG